ncbi:MAG TPA: cyclic nucleotide-binding protein, partial [Acidimicrobiia bacterium]|nr:cyclic nucleotide-binding protein [Acidimicrobiia bacterium]
MKRRRWAPQVGVVDTKTNLWEVLAGRAPGQPLGPADDNLWRKVTERLNPAKATPRIRDGIEEVTLTSVRGETYVMLRSPDDNSAGYLRLTPEEVSLAHRMDGATTVASLVGEFAALTGQLAPDRVLRLVADLAGNRMLEELPVDSFHPLQRYRSTRGPLPDRLARGVLAVIRGRRMVLANPDRLVGWLYRVGAKLVFTRAAAIVMVAVAVAGLVLFGITWLGGAESIFLVGDSYVQGALVLLLLNAFALASHELGHALAAKHAGRRVPAVGFLLYFGLPSVFVDTTDVWMAGRRARLLTSAAGPAAALTFAGTIQLVALAAPSLGPIAFKIAFVWYLNSLFNLNPLMALDGYYLFMDWLELPNLRPRAMAMVSGWLRHRRPRWRQLGREDRMVAVYAILALAWLVVMLNMMVRVWRDRIAGLATGLWHAGIPGRVLMVAITAALAAPLLFAVLSFLARLWRKAMTKMEERKRTRDLPGRVDALRASALGFLAESELTALAEEAHWLHPRTGSLVMGGQGPPLTEALVVVDGALEGRKENDPPGTIRKRALPGDVVSPALDTSTPGLGWITAGTTLLAVPVRLLGERIALFINRLPPDERDDQRKRLVGPLIMALAIAPTIAGSAGFGIHPVGGYPPLTPRPAEPGDGDDQRDDRFLRSLFLLLLVGLLLALLTAPLAAMDPTVWAEMPPETVLLTVEQGDVVLNADGIPAMLGSGDRRHLQEGDEVEVREKSSARLTFDGGATAILCPFTEGGIGPLHSTSALPVRVSGELDLHRGTVLADTAPRSRA